MSETEHDERELAIFEIFVRTSSLPVFPGSILKRPPPEPDILCDVEGEGPVAFELGEILGEEFAGHTYTRPRLRQRFNDEYARLDAMVRADIEARLGAPPAVIVSFTPGTPSGRWARAIQPILSFLAAHRHTLVAGEVRVWEFPALYALLTDMDVMPATSGRPGLHAAEMTELTDESRRVLGAKFNKQYHGAAPKELLAYYASQPPSSDPAWVSGIASFIEEHRPFSSFRRVWLFDGFHRRIVLVDPAIPVAPARE